MRAVALFVLAGVINACGDDGPPTLPDPPRPTTIVIEPASATLSYISETTSFTATVRDQYGAAMAATVTWSSSDESVFSVSSSGQVTAVGNGSGTLQASSGALSANATVEVQQRAAAIKLVSGDGQEALRGTKLPEPVRVRLEDRGGHGVAGQEITFAPGAESGSVSVESATSDEGGEGATEWTLGAKVGSQTLVISVPGGIQNRAEATAIADTALADLTVETLTLSRNDPTDLETLDITPTIANQGDAASPDNFQVQLTLDGIVQKIVDVPQLESGSETNITFTVGPVEAGKRLLTVVIDPDGRIDESNRENNVKTEGFTVAHQELITVGHTSNISAKLDDVLFFRIDIKQGSNEALNVEVSGGQGDPDLFVHYGFRPDHHHKYSCISGERPGTAELCQLLPARSGSYHVAVHAYSTFGPVELKVSVGGTEVETYDIDLVFIQSGTPEQELAIRKAAERWESVIAIGVGDFDASVEPIDNLDQCGQGLPVVSDVIDDIRIFVRIDSIDGPGNIAAGAGPCVTRALTFEGAPRIVRSVLIGDMVFDKDDLRDWPLETVVAVATHEIAHVIGFGTLWNAFELLKSPSIGGRPDADTHFAGSLARRAFEGAGGRNYKNGAIVPVENNGVVGSADGHWRESVFENELLTPYASPGFQPLSVITIESMADLGYSVDPTVADQYRIPPSAGAAGMVVDPESVIDLSNDIADYPIVFIDQKGRRVDVLRPRR